MRFLCCSLSSSLTGSFVIGGVISTGLVSTGSVSVASVSDSSSSELLLEGKLGCVQIEVGGDSNTYALLAASSTVAPSVRSIRAGESSFLVSNSPDLILVVERRTFKES